MTVTNLKEVKRVAEMLLYVDIEVNPRFPIVVVHPFFNSPVYPNITKNGTEFLNIVESENDLNIARNIVSKIIEESDNVSQIFMIANKPYQPTFFKYMKQYLGKKDYADILNYVWVTTEYPNRDINVSTKEWLKIFKQAERKYFMDKEELEIFNELPEIITIYRGFYNDKYCNALSWTLDKMQARWFANRFNQNGAVYEAKIEKKYIFAYLNSIEKEVIIDFKHILEPKIVCNK